jgi:hypothetical protein
MRFSDYVSRATSFGHMDDCCGTCGSHFYEDGEYVCKCRASPYCEEFTEYDDYCDEYHERGTPRRVPSAQEDFDF